jgi:hypothetical protein
MEPHFNPSWRNKETRNIFVIISRFTGLQKRKNNNEFEKEHHEETIVLFVSTKCIFIAS